MKSILKRLDILKEKIEVLRSRKSVKFIPFTEIDENGKMYIQEIPIDEIIKKYNVPRSYYTFDSAAAFYEQAEAMCDIWNRSPAVERRIEDFID